VFTVLLLHIVEYFRAGSIKQIHQMDDLQMVQLLSMDMCCHILKLMGNTSSMYVFVLLVLVWLLECVRSSKG
jgi:hypothetical protein